MQNPQEEIRKLKRELKFTKIELDVQKNHLERIRDLYGSLTSTLDLDEVLHILLQNLSDLVNYDIATVYMKNGNNKNERILLKKNHSLYIQTGENIDEAIQAEENNINTNEVLKRVYQKQDLVLIPKLNPKDYPDIVKGESYVESIMALPIKNLGKVVAVLILYSSLSDAFVKEVASLTQILVNQAGVAIDNANFVKELDIKNKKIEQLNKQLANKNNELEILVDKRTEKLNSMTLALVTSLENANLYNDENTGKHIIRVAAYSELIAKKYGLEDDLVKEIHLYAPLHDIGKVGIPDSVLKKPGRYNEEEFLLMQNHVKIGYKMIADAPLPMTAKNIVKYHHEKFNGAGYCDKTKGKEIPIEARIVAIADVFDALTARRVYKEPYPVDKALRIMRESRGEHFDPELLDIFLNNIDDVLKLREEHADEEE